MKDLFRRIRIRQNVDCFEYSSQYRSTPPFAYSITTSKETVIYGSFFRLNKLWKLKKTEFSVTTEAKRFIVTGITVNSIGYLFYCLITILGLTPAFASLLIFIFSMLISFVLNSFWTFRLGTKVRFSIFLKYLFLYFVLFFIYKLVFSFAIQSGIDHYISQATVVVMVSFLSFILQRVWVFAK